MTRIFVDTPLNPGAEPELTGSPLQHLKARRLRPGDAVTLFDGNGGEHEATLLTLERRAARLRLDAFHDYERESALELVLLQGIGKSERMDFAVQKAVELGARRIVPVLTAHGVVQIPPERRAKRQSHWQRVAESACEQCGRNQVPAVSTPIPLAGVWPEVADLTGLVLSPAGETAPRTLAPPDRGFAVLVGPEGGLSDDEVAEAVARGFHRLQLGPRVLRTETAALTALAVLQTLFGDLG